MAVQQRDASEKLLQSVPQEQHPAPVLAAGQPGAEDAWRVPRAQRVAPRRRRRCVLCVWPPAARENAPARGRLPAADGWRVLGGTRAARRAPSPTLTSTVSLIYLGIIATGAAWLLRFRILTVNGLVFQTQVAYIIPLVGVIFGYLIMDEVITWKVLVSLFLIVIGIYIVKKNNKGYKK